MGRSSANGTKKRKLRTGLSSRWRAYLSGRGILYILEGAALSAGVGWLFYQSVIAMALLSPLSIPYSMYRAKGNREKEKRVLSEQFRDMLGSVLQVIGHLYWRQSVKHSREQDSVNVFTVGSHSYSYHRVLFSHHSKLKNAVWIRFN